MNEIGWKNLLLIHWDACKNGFYYKPRTDLDFLAEHSEGLIATTACLGSPLLNVETPEEGEANLARLKEIFPGRLFVELQFNEVPEQKKATPRLITMARGFDVPMCYGLDSHYVYPFDVYVHDVLLLSLSKKTIEMEDWEDRTYKARSLFLKSYGQCLKAPMDFGYEVPRELVKEALANNDVIADMVEFGGGQKYSKRSVMFIAMGHVSEHMGQMIAYARSNDIAPPWSQPAEEE